MLEIQTVSFIIIYFIVGSHSLPVPKYHHPPYGKYRNHHRINFSATTDSSYATAFEPLQPFSYGVKRPADHGYNRRAAHGYNSRKTESLNRRGLDIGVRLHIATTTTQKYANSLEKLEDVLEKALGGRLEEVLNTSGCPSCDEEVPEVPIKRTVKPAYKCDEWDAKFRICILERNIGDTVTFYLSLGVVGGHKPNVTWRKEFHLRDSKVRKDVIIDPENSPENIIIGRRGYELRISPITEIDLGYNMFSATLQGSISGRNKVFFMIRIVPIDLGFVYVGETIDLNLRSYVSLPAESMAFKWYMEKDGEHGTLPSNMRMSVTGSSIKISELRQEQEGILACSVYTNLNFLATKKRFLMKDLVKNNDVLKSPPDHTLFFKESSAREKRYPNIKSRRKRETDVDEVIEKALMESTTLEKPFDAVTTQVTTTRSDDDYNIESDVGREEPASKTPDNKPQSSGENDGGFQEISQNVDDNENKDLPESKQVDISVDSAPVDVDGSQDMAPNVDESRGQNINEGFQNQPEGAVDNGLQPSVVKVQSGFKPANKYSNNQRPIIGENAPDDLSLEVQGPNGQLASSRQQAPGQQQGMMTPQKTGRKQYLEKGKKQYVDIDIQNKNNADEIILNIDKFPRRRRLSAEEKVAKLISSCYSDFECSGSAICARNNLKVPGFCRCLPGFYGVGIFCREDIWMSSGNFEMDELSNADDSYSSDSSAIPKNNVVI